MEIITYDPEVMMGKPVITGTRVTVESILEALGAGESFDQIISGHPELTHEALLASIEFGAKAIKAEWSNMRTKNTRR